MTWLILFCTSFPHIRTEEEKDFRVNQLCGVLYSFLQEGSDGSKIYSSFEDVLQCLVQFGNLGQITQINTLMNFCKIKTSTKIHNLYFMAMKKAKKGSTPITIPINQGKSGIDKSELNKWACSLDPSNKETIASKLRFGKRTLRDAENLNNFMIKDMMFMS